MDRQSASLEWQAPMEKVPEQPPSEGSFVDRFLKKRKQSGERSLPLGLLASKPETPTTAHEHTPQPETTHESEAQAASTPELSTAFLAKLHTLGESTLRVVFETKDKLAAAQESEVQAPATVELPEMAQLDIAAEDVGDALEQLDSTIEMSAEPMAEPEVMYDRSQETQVSSGQEYDIDPAAAVETEDASMESPVPSGWSRGVRASALHIAGKMAHRLEARGSTASRPATTAELGVVAALVGGPLGLLFVGERSNRRREIRQFKKEQRKLEETAVQQQEIIDHHEQRLATVEGERLAGRQSHPEVLAQIRHEAHQVAVEAHQQAHTIRSAAVDVKFEQQIATPSQNEIDKPTVTKERSAAIERSQPTPRVETEAQPRSLVERFKPLLGVETPESESVAKKVSGDGMSSGGGGTPLKRVREMLDPATLSQNPVVQQAQRLQKTIQTKAQEPVWLYGAALAAGLLAVIAWIFWR